MCRFSVHPGASPRRPAGPGALAELAPLRQLDWWGPCDRKSARGVSCSSWTTTPNLTNAAARRWASSSRAPGRHAPPSGACPVSLRG